MIKRTFFGDATLICFSVAGGRRIRTFLDCEWVTTQIMDGHKFTVAPTPDLVIGYTIQVGEDGKICVFTYVTFSRTLDTAVIEVACL